MKLLNRKTTGLTKKNKIKVLQFGEGNFLRGFVDWIIDILNEKTDFNGAVQVVQPIDKGIAHLLQQQEGLYHLRLQGIQQGKLIREKELISCISGAINPYEDDRAGHVEAKAYASVCEQLLQRFPKASKAIITLRGSVSASHNSWSGVLYDGQQLFQAPTYQITHIVDRVGGGDSFMAGLIYGLLSYENDDQKALNFAVAASALKHTISGDFNLVTVDEVEKLMKGDASGRVSR